MDTGIRIEEALGVREEDVDLDKLLLKVRGKGRKERLVPVSFELRRVLFRWTQVRGDLVVNLPPSVEVPS
jgi:integrase/recombinase XerD